MSNPIVQEGSKIMAEIEKQEGIIRIWKALFYSLAGIADAYRSEAAFRQETWLAIILIPATFFLPVSILFKSFLLCSVLLVLMMELINSAIEAVVDKVMPDFDHLAKKAKDMGSAAVLFALVNLGMAWAAAIFAVAKQ